MRNEMKEKMKANGINGARIENSNNKYVLLYFPLSLR